jgi:hypothetical protein
MASHAALYKFKMKSNLIQIFLPQLVLLKIAVSKKIISLHDRILYLEESDKAMALLSIAS